MKNAFFVRCLQRFGNLLSQRESFIDRERPALQSRGECLAFDEFEDEKSRSAIFLNVMDDADVWMIQRCENLCFALKPGEPDRVVRKCARQHFDRNVTPQLSVSRLINLTHAADADQLEILVVSQRR